LIVHRVLLLSDVNMANFAAALRSESSQVPTQVIDPGYGTVFPVLHDLGSEAWLPKPDLAIVWTRPEGVLPSYAAALEGELVTPEAVDGDVRRFAEALQVAAPRSRWMLVPSWVPTFGHRGLGVIDLHAQYGMRALLARANAELLTHLRALPQCWMLDASAWVDGATDRRLWYAAKVPFTMSTLRAAARDVRAFLSAATGRARKIVILDLDNTLWGGIVGEEGYQGLRLGGHDPVGEAFVDFQRALLALTRRGVVLAVASKNEESVALEAFRKHPDMVLREEHLAARRINWRDKAENIREILAELRLGADAAVFLDDQPAERARVADTFPDMLVPDWPADGLTSVERLERLACFDLLGISEEDVSRANSYATERQRRELLSNATTSADWLQQLQVRVNLSRLDGSDLARAAQLLNKTNQMNLRTRRLSEGELLEWTRAPNRSMVVCRVSDRFSDFGLTGIISVEVRGGDVGYVEDFLLSCRVMTRRVEDVLLRAAAVEAARLGARTLVAEFLPTPRNAPMLSFLQSAGLQSSDGRCFVLTTADERPAPEPLIISGPGSAP
jgi:FkbH-like protein